MKIAVFSDIHGNVEALKAIIEDIKNKEISNVVCLGDCIGIGPFPKECLDLIIDNHIEMVLGNHELYYLRGTDIDKMDDIQIEHQKWVAHNLNKKHFEFLSNCPLKIEKKVGKYQLLFQHFLFDDENSQYPFADISVVKNKSIIDFIRSINGDFLFIGHEHKPFHIEYPNKRLIDVGSSGCRFDDTTFYTIVNINDDIKIEKVYLKYDRNLFIEKYKKVRYPDSDNICKIFFGM